MSSGRCGKATELLTHLFTMVKFRFSGITLKPLADKDGLSSSFEIAGNLTVTKSVND
jgi:hypothetical protein